MAPAFIWPYIEQDIFKNAWTTFLHTDDYFFFSSNSFVWMTKVCSLFKTDATNVDYTIILMKAPGKSEKPKNFQKSRWCICYIFKPSGCEGKITQLKAHKKDIDITLHPCTDISLRRRSRGSPAVTHKKRIGRVQRCYPGPCDSSLNPALHSACSHALIFHITANPLSASSMPTLLFHQYCSWREFSNINLILSRCN